MSIKIKKAIRQCFAPLRWVVANRKNFFLFCFMLSIGVLCLGWIKQNDEYILFCLVPTMVAFFVATVVGIWKGDIKIFQE